MDMRKTVLNLGLRALRLAGGLLLIYASMVFYLALTERQNAYPRAITHNEAQALFTGRTKPERAEVIAL